MPDYILFMHDDAPASDPAAWAKYIETLRQNGTFEGGSEIGGGLCARKDGVTKPLTDHLAGYIRLIADDLDHVKSLLAGNPHFEAGGTVEIRELPRS
jgi:hypothetical protein